MTARYEAEAVAILASQPFPLTPGERTHQMMVAYLAGVLEAFDEVMSHTPDPHYFRAIRRTFVKKAVERGANFCGPIILAHATDTAEAYDNGHAAGMNETRVVADPHAADCESLRNAPGACTCSPEVDEPSVGDEPRMETCEECRALMKPSRNGGSRLWCDRCLIGMSKAEENLNAGLDEDGNGQADLDDDDEPRDLEDDGFALASAFGPNDDDMGDVWGDDS